MYDDDNNTSTTTTTTTTIIIIIIIIIIISYDAHHLYLIHHSSCLIPYSGLHYNTSVTLTFQTLSGCRRAFRLGTAAWGVRRVSSLALPVYLASAASTFSLQNEILSGCVGSKDTFFQTDLLSWSDSFGNVSEALPAKQSVWDRPGIELTELWLSPTLAHFQLASFQATSSAHSGDWLFALQISPCGLCLYDEAVRIAVSVRLGMAICVPHNCHCGSLVDATTTTQRPGLGSTELHL